MKSTDWINFYTQLTFRWTPLRYLRVIYFPNKSTIFRVNENQLILFYSYPVIHILQLVQKYWTLEKMSHKSFRLWKKRNYIFSRLNFCSIKLKVIFKYQIFVSVFILRGGKFLSKSGGDILFWIIIKLFLVSYLWMHNISSYLKYLFFFQGEESFKVLIDVIIVHDIETSFWLVVFVHIFQYDKGFKWFEFLILAPFFIYWIILIEI